MVEFPLVTDFTPGDNPAIIGFTVTMNPYYDEVQTMIHEFSHRMEDVCPHIGTLEGAFVASRTTLKDGTREPLVVYKSGAESSEPEMMREDRFVEPYIGKEYPGDTNYEVLSMGSESVFHGSMGGLLGIGYNRSGPEMRNWILGVFATQ